VNTAILRELHMADPRTLTDILPFAERAEMIEFLRESREDLQAGRTEAALEALERLARKHKMEPEGK
jgi:hypothetical protein